MLRCSIPQPLAWSALIVPAAREAHLEGDMLPQITRPALNKADSSNYHFSRDHPRQVFLFYSSRKKIKAQTTDKSRARQQA